MYVRVPCTLRYTVRFDFTARPAKEIDGFSEGICIACSGSQNQAGRNNVGIWRFPRQRTVPSQCSLQNFFRLTTDDTLSIDASVYSIKCLRQYSYFHRRARVLLLGQAESKFCCSHLKYLSKTLQPLSSNTSFTTMGPAHSTVANKSNKSICIITFNNPDLLYKCEPICPLHCSLS